MCAEKTFSGFNELNICVNSEIVYSLEEDKVNGHFKNIEFIILFLQSFDPLIFRRILKKKDKLLLTGDF